MLNFFSSEDIMRYDGKGKIQLKVILSIDLEAPAEDLDDAYGIADDDLDYIAEEAKSTLVEWTKQYNDAALLNGSSIYEIETEIVSAEIESLDCSGEFDRAYDSYRDEQMMEGI